MNNIYFLEDVSILFSHTERGEESERGGQRDMKDMYRVKERKTETDLERDRRRRMT